MVTAAVIAAASFGVAGVAAQEQRPLEVTVDRPQIPLGSQFYLTIRVEGGVDDPPRLPDLPDFRVVSRGQRRDMAITNGRVSSSTSWNYLLIPTRAGVLEIGPATAVVDGAEVSSQPFTVEVAAADAAGVGQSGDLFVTASVSTERPWQGQQVVYTWRFYSRVPVGQGQIESMDFGPDVLAEDLGEVRQFQTALNGVQYSVNEVRKALFPQRSGVVELPPTQLRVDVQAEQASRRGRRRSLFDDFDSLLGRGGRWETRFLVTEPVSLDVQPLPTPPAAWTGLVGDFSVRASLSRQQLQVGQSATLEVEVAGDGNVQLLSEPSFPQLPAFKIYPDQPDGSIDRTGVRLTGRKVFRRALVPLLAGALEVPPLDLVYFDPERGEYATRSTETIDLEVAPFEGEEELMLTESMAPTTGKVAVRILADDILPIHRTAAGIESAMPTGWRWWLWLLGAVLPPLVYLSLLLAHRRERRYAADRTLLRRQRALRRALAAAKALDAGGAARGSSAAEPSRVLRAYVGDKLGIEGAALTPAETERALLDAGADELLAGRCRDLLERLEAAQYGPVAAAGSPLGAGGGASAGGGDDDLTGLIRALHRQLARPKSTLAARRSASRSALLLLAAGFAVGALAGLASPVVSAQQEAPEVSDDARGDDGAAVRDRLDVPPSEPLALPLPSSREAPAGSPESPGTTGLSASEASRSPTAPSFRESGPVSPGPSTPSTAEAVEAVEPSELWVNGNAAFEAGDHERAVALYLELRAMGVENGHLHFNLGNAHLRTGALGHAIASYRRSLRLLPRDEDTRANLAFARRSARDEIAPPEPPALLRTALFWHYGLAPAEAFRSAVAVGVAFWILLAVRLYRRESEVLRWAVVCLLLVGLALGGSLAVHAAFDSVVAVVTPPEINLHAAAGEGSVVRFQLHAGTEVRVIELRPEWVRIELPDGQRGWSRREYVEIVD